MQYSCRLNHVLCQVLTVQNTACPADACDAGQHTYVHFCGQDESSPSFGSVSGSEIRSYWCALQALWISVWGPLACMWVLCGWRPRSLESSLSTVQKSGTRVIKARGLALLGLLLALSTLCFITPRWVIRRKGFSQIDCSRMQSGPCAFWLFIPLSQSSTAPGLEYISGTVPRCMRWLQ